MIIDFHTHVFPDKIAEKTISFLAGKAEINPFSNGTVLGLIDKMAKGGVDVSIALPVLTDPKQFDSIFKYTKSINDGEYSNKIISFMGIHPDIENPKDKLQLIKDSGFKGIKIHPDYQGAYFNDDRYVKIMQIAKSLDLIVVTHAGVDYGFKDRPVMCTPDKVLDVLEKVGDFKLVLAHYGGYRMTGEVYNKLCGKNVYFDTSYLLKEISEEDFKKVLYKHGDDKILFATDSPWSDIKSDVDRLKSFNLDKETEEKIFYKNAKTLLGI